MKLKELIEQATPLPYSPDWGRIRNVECKTVCGFLGNYDDPQWVVDKHLLTHAVNMLPKLVAALEEHLAFAAVWSLDPCKSPNTMGVAFERLRAVLAEANNPEVPQ